MTKRFPIAAAALVVAIAGCAPMCQSPWDYCNAVINPNGHPNCNYGARYNSTFAPMYGTPPTTPVEPTPALEQQRAEAAEEPLEPLPSDQDDYFNNLDSSSSP